jgi:alcohol dehydrogenase
MKAIVYHGPGQKAWEEVPDPVIQAATDAIVRVDAVTICGTDLHILKGDVPAVTEGRILGHEAVGTVEAVGSGHDDPSGRSRARLMHHLVRPVQVLP